LALRLTHLFPVCLVAVTLCGIVMVARPAMAAPQCVAMKFYDKDGVLVFTPEPIIAIMIGGKPAMEGQVPDVPKMEPGAEVACPTALLAEVRATFEANCVSEDRRNNAMKEHNVDRKIVDKGCSDIIESLDEHTK
jgi:hypothetical protein